LKVVRHKPRNKQSNFTHM